MEKVKVLFVCMGNICRSPTAEGVFTQLINDQQLEDYFRIDSAGTHAYHIGDAPDLRSQKAARERGVDLGFLCATVKGWSRLQPTSPVCQLGHACH